MHPPTTPSRALVAPAALMAAILVGATALACGSSDTPTTPKAPTWVTTLSGANEVPTKAVPGTGTATIVKNGGVYTYTITYAGLTGTPNNAHIHGPARTDQSVGVIVPFSVAGATGASGTLTGTFTSTNNPAISNDSLEVLMTNGSAYVNVHTAANGGGEIRGQLSKQP